MLITPMPSVASNIGANRIVIGTAITHPLGDPELGHDAEKTLRRRMVETALEVLAERVESQTVRLAS